MSIFTKSMFLAVVEMKYLKSYTFFRFFFI